MNIIKEQTETYVLTDLYRLDQVTVYVKNYHPGVGKITIDCYGQAWTAYFGSMPERSLQEFILDANNQYIIDKMLQTMHQTDFDKIYRDARELGFDICATSDVELAMQADEMHECFGGGWMMDLPTCVTPEYEYLSRILDAVKSAFRKEQQQAA